MFEVHSGGKMALSMLSMKDQPVAALDVHVILNFFEELQQRAPAR